MIPQIIEYSPDGERCGACGCRCDGRRLNLTLENRLVCDQCYDRESMSELKNIESKTVVDNGSVY